MCVLGGGKKKAAGERRELGMLKGFLTETLEQQPVSLLIPKISDESTAFRMNNKYCVTAHNNTYKLHYIKFR